MLNSPLANKLATPLPHRSLDFPASLLVGSGMPSSAFDDVWGWWRADNISGSSPTMSFVDLSGNSRTMTQTAGSLTAGTAANGQARVTGNGTATLSVSGSNLAAWPMTVITVCKRTAGQTCGMFGASGASPFNNHWFGWEGSNALYSWNGQGATNTDTTGGTTGCYISRVGYGSRVQMVNGMIQPAMGLASISRASSVAPSIGTTYRGLNCEWQETLCWNRLLSLDELDEVHTYINTRYGLTIPLWSSYSPAKTIWIGGQSNASNRGARGASDVNVPAEYDAPITGCNVFYGTPVGSIGTAFETLNINTPNHMLADVSQQATYFGFGVVTPKEYLDAHGGSLYLLNVAQGSSNLAYNGTSGPSRHWDFTDNTPVHANSNRMVGVLGQNWWQSLRLHQAANRKPNLIAAIWYQGEQDATNSTYASAYQANIEAFFPLLDAEHGVPYSKLLMCRIHSGIDLGVQPYRETVRAAQNAAAGNIRNCTLVSVDGYSLFDTAHIDYLGQIALGQYLATQI